MKNKQLKAIIVLLLILCLFLSACSRIIKSGEYGYMAGYFVGMSLEEFDEVQSHWFENCVSSSTPGSNIRDVTTEMGFPISDTVEVSPSYVSYGTEQRVINITIVNRYLKPMDIEACKTEEANILAALIAERGLAEVTENTADTLDEIRDLTGTNGSLFGAFEGIAPYSAMYDKNSPDYAEMEGYALDIENIDYCSTHYWDDGKSVTMFTIMHCTRNTVADSVYALFSQAQKTEDGNGIL